MNHAGEINALVVRTGGNSAGALEHYFLDLYLKKKNSPQPPSIDGELVVRLTEKYDFMHWKKLNKKEPLIIK